jgi:hypothetical protein
MSNTANSLNIKAAGIPVFDGTATFTETTTTQYNVLVGSTSNAIANVAPSATVGVALVSGGSSANPSFGTVVIAGGGTNATSMTNTNGVVYYDGTRLVTTTVGTATYVLTSNGAGFAPTFQAASSGGGAQFTVTPVNHLGSPYTVLGTDQYISVDASGGVVSILLPNTTTTGRYLVIKDATGSAATNNITVTTVGGAVNIDGSTSFVMNTNYEAGNFLWDGSAYEIF